MPPWWTFGFTGSGKAKDTEEKQKFDNEQFGDVFEEILREEGMAENGGTPTGKFWSVVGGLSGGAMGFIIANFPGSRSFSLRTFLFSCFMQLEIKLWRLKGVLT